MLFILQMQYLNICFSTGENCKIFHEQEGEKTLIALLDGENSPSVQAGAAQALATMAESAVCRLSIADFGKFYI